jgi:predicted enzyme related to lactoylglutathione lyase
MKLSLYRIILFGKDITRLKHFYTSNFGLVVAEEIGDEWVVLKTGEIEIALHKIGKQYINDESDFTADNNIKLVFRISDDLHSFRKKLIENSVMVQEIKSFPGINSLFCDGQDCEGNVFQLEQKLS